MRATNRYATQQPNSMYHISVLDVEKRLAKVKPNKAPGPDGITSWMLRDLSAQLAGPVAALFNSSIRDGYVPQPWKSAYITALPKKSPPQAIQTDLRPVSLTSLLAKELERFVAQWLKKNRRSSHRLPSVRKPARGLYDAYAREDVGYLGEGT